MSTKTTIKRIALVAAVAAAFGGLSTVAANATVTASTLLVNGTYGTGVGTAAGTQVTGGLINVDLVETSTASSVAGTLVSTGVGAIAGYTAADSTALTAPAGTVYPTSSVTLTNGTDTAVKTNTITLSSSVAGTQTLTFTPINSLGAPGTAQTVTITWGAAPVVSAQYSTVSEYAGASASGIAVTTTSASSSALSAGSQAAVAAVAVTTMASSTVAMPTDTVLATISGPGSLGGNTTNSAVASQGRSISETASSAGHTYFYVYPDGTAGTSTITFTDGTVVLGTATVVFVGSPTKATATQNLFIAPAGAILGQVATQYATTGVLVGDNTTPSSTSATGTYAVTIYATDANGNAASFSGWTPTITNSNSAVVSGNSCVADSSNAGYYYCSVSGANAAVDGSSATVTWTWTNTAGTTVISTSPVTFTIGGAIAKVAIATDASSYSALAPLAIVASATDSNGHAAYDQDAALFTLAGLTASTQLGGSALPTNTTVPLISGNHTFKGFYAPTVAGSFTITGTDGTTAANVVSATASSVGGSADTQAAAATDAANEATDAANAATDAANAAADAADAATSAAQDAGAKADAALAAVTALSAKITVLAAQIAKIVKKLKA